MKAAHNFSGRLDLRWHSQVDRAQTTQTSQPHEEELKLEPLCSNTYHVLKGGAERTRQAPPDTSQLAAAEPRGNQRISGLATALDNASSFLGPDPGPVGS